ncbi:MAG: hypothetical protein Q9M16_06495 [Mariprofundus sp.]|nr:hypothetical protein [Mariprofundus sp.]
MNLMTGFFQAMWRMPWFWRVWVGVLMALNAIIPLFFMAMLEAQAVVGTFMLAAITQMLIFQRYGFVRLLGLGHIYWIPMLLWLWAQGHDVGMGSGFMLWFTLLLLCNAVSLLIDSMDVLRYWRGEKSPTI